MKTAIAIVDDRVVGINGILLTMEALLCQAQKTGCGGALSAEDTQIFFFHILWINSSNECSQDCSQKNILERMTYDLRHRVETSGNEFVDISYTPIFLDLEEYEQSSSKTYERVCKEMDEAQKKWAGKSPESQILLLDIILNEHCDLDRMNNSAKDQKTLAQQLHAKFGSAHCIPYTIYKEERVPKKWQKLVPESITPIQRQAISSQAIYVPFEKAFYNALNITLPER